MIIIKNMDEIEKYYNENTNTYIFNEDVRFNCDIDIKNNIKAINIDALDIKANDIEARDIKALDIKAKYIYAHNIYARDINAHNIDVYDIKSYDIKARDIDANDIIASNIDSDNISYYSICIARNSLKCKKIKGRYENAIHKCLDNDIEFINDYEKTFAINNENINYLIEQELTNLKKEVEIFKKINLAFEWVSQSNM